ncbi:hypothetical protein [Dawidia soli]|uniref:Uncharacterized protein n=1 Tax=Dawidia soli TaxID=2782352 RepID=A0AAP2DC17_9BACT|nr:hypothetical protein [Dawidia soli]MBT1689113.1 hypothetical protein [Dawidia soli]
MRKQHALHNESLCDHLLINGNYNDWVVTSAFYSALHFVYHELFPLVVANTTYLSFDDYYHTEIIGKNKRESKHRVTVDLVYYHLAPCYFAYKALFDMCMFARYNNYRTTPRKAKVAKSHLDVVKRQCPKQ